MAPKIKEPILEELIIACYEEILGNGYSRTEMFEKIKTCSISFLEKRGYVLCENKVRCDASNNPPNGDIIERIFVDVYEENFPGFSGYIHHKFIL